MSDKVEAYFNEASKRLAEKYPEGTKFTGKNMYQLMDDLQKIFDNIPDEYWEERHKEWTDKLPPTEEIDKEQ